MNTSNHSVTKTLFGKTLLATIVALTLNGCGSESQKSTTPPPAPTPTPPPATQALKLSGLAVDNPLQNAEITVTVGDKTFSAITDSDGNYQVTLALTEAEIAASPMVVINAQGVDAQDHAELIGIVASAGSLYEASEDGALTNESNQRLNITHVSTAKYILTMDQTNGEIPQTDEALSDNEEAISGEQIIELAGVIKVIVDNPDYDLAEGQTTLDLLDKEDVSADDAIDDYLESIGELEEDGTASEAFEGAHQEAVQKTLTEGIATEKFDTESLIGTNIITAKVQAGYPVWFANGFTLNEDGTGSYSEIIHSAIKSSDITWKIDKGMVKIDDYDLSTPISVNIYSDDFYDTFPSSSGLQEFLQDKYENGEMHDPYIGANLTVHSATLQPISQTTEEAEVYMTEVSSHIIPNEWLTPLGWTKGTVSSGQKTNESYQTILLPEKLNALTLTQDSLAGTWALPLDYQVKDFFQSGELVTESYHDLIELKADGKAVMKLAEAEGTWSYVDQGIEVTQGDIKHRYQPFEDTGYFYSTLISKYVNDEIQYSVVRAIAKQSYSMTDATKFVRTEYPNFLFAGINAWIASFYEDGEPAQDLLYGYSFFDNGAMKNVGASFDNTYCTTTKTEHCVVKWDNGYNNYVADDNRFALTRNRRTATYDRYWYPLSMKDGKLSVLEYERVYNADYESLNDSFRVKPRVNTIEPKALSDWGDLWYNSPLYAALESSRFNATLKDEDGEQEQISLIKGQPFTNKNVIGTFHYPDIDLGTTEKVIFLPGGTGSLTCCGGDTEALTWQVNEDGTLSFTSTDSSGDQFIHHATRIVNQDNDILLKLTTPAGQEDAEDLVILLPFTKQ